MRIPINCKECGLSGKARPAVFIEFRDDGRYEFTCEDGHKTVTILQQQRFEILFDIGAYAILDGYYRDAVASFASSLERFYEFFILASFLEDDLDYQVFHKTWTNVSSQSERQLGAFIFIYLKSFSSPPPLLKSSNFRNKVIHQGKIPSREEAINFGNEVLSIIRPTMELVKNKFPRGVEKSVIQHITGCRKPDDQHNIATLHVPMILNLMYCDSPEKSLEDALVDKQLYQRWQKSGL
ncbi:hypothetical protein [Aeromonas dhakensis]|uniref:hypothetical protein n=1 Tax=Aeromonas dhakensis TaxID=196024 RepID=UPI003986B39B